MLVYYIIFCLTVFLNLLVRHVTCMCMEKYLSPVLSKTERPAPPPIGLGWAGTCGPVGSEEAGKGVLSTPCLSRGNSPDRVGVVDTVSRG